MNSIHVKKLSKTFKGAKALNAIDFSASQGEMVALIGASGSGKSTLIRLIAGLMASDKGDGEVSVLGKSMQANGVIAKDARQQRPHISVIFQQFNLVSRLSVLTNVLLGTLGAVPGWRGSLGLFSKAEKLEAMHALDRVGMAKYAVQRASTLSGGQQQRVAIARALMQNSEIILADEPIASLDPEAARKVLEALAKINREDGKTIIVSLHQVDYALKYRPRTLALKDGQIHYDGLSSELSSEFLCNLYGSSCLDMQIPILNKKSEVSSTMAISNSVGTSTTSLKITDPVLGNA
ncbi:MAG: phosphonate ABC transporter ATP-binding protein [Magnetovibrio sp.]|nr:phosphonate ABC transporter ATP-binding protein [Magnetovibrio sp.]